MSKRSKFCLLGIPDHQGVANVGGRIGAASGPKAFRKLWKRFKSEDSLADAVQDVGDLTKISNDAEANHRQAAQWIAATQAMHPVSVIVGGGHDHGFSHLWGIRDALKRPAKKALRLGCINLDAHLDVRKAHPVPTSGSPFYLAIESGVLDPKRLVEFGIQSHCNDPELWQYARKREIPVVPFAKLRGGLAVRRFKRELSRLAGSCDAIVISLDMDCVCEASAPGVSAPQAEGFAPSEIIEMMEISGREKKVVSLGIFELNPIHDIADATARLAATAAFHFLQAKA